MTVMDMGGFSVLKASSFFFLTLTQTYGEVGTGLLAQTPPLTMEIPPRLSSAIDRQPYHRPVCLTALMSLGCPSIYIYIYI